MDEKKLAQLYKAFVAKGASLPPESDFVSALQDESVAKNFFDTFQKQGAFNEGYSFDSFKTDYGKAAPVSNGLAGSIMDFGASVLEKKAESDRVNTENASAIQESIKRQGGKTTKPVTGNLDVGNVPLAQIDYYGNATNIDRPKDAAAEFFQTEEIDPLKVGMRKYAEAKKPVTPTTQLQQIVEQNRPQIDPNNPLQVSAARYQKAINRDKAAIADIETSLIAPNGESGIMDYILPKSELSQLSDASSMLNVNMAAKNLQERLDKGEILSKTQSNALQVIQNKVKAGEVGIKDVSTVIQAIEANDDNALLPYVAPLDREFAKTAYNDIDKDRTAAAYKKLPSELTSKERLGFWFGTTKYNQQREDKDDPAYLPYTMLAHDDQNISQQIERLKTLFPDQKEGAMSLEPPKGLAAEFPKPAERAYAYYQILANRYTQLTKELQNESISIDKEDKANLLDERLKANALLQGAAMFLPIVGVQDVTNPKVKEWYSVLNKINALAPMIRNAKVGAGEKEATDGSLGRFANAAAEGALDIYGAPYEKADRARVAGEQSEVINDAEINAKTGMNPESVAILKERSRSGDIDDLATWGNAAGGFAGIMLPFVAASMAGGNKMQGVTKGLSRLDKGSQIGKILLNTEGGLTKTGWLAQKAINLGMTGLQYEYAGAISGEGKELRNELRFSQGALGYAGSQALTGSLGLLMKGAGKIGGKFASKIPYFEKGIKAIEDVYGSKYANYAKAYLANGFSELGEEIPQDWRNNLDEVKGDDTFQKMLAAAQKTADDIAYDDIEGEYSLSKIAGYALPIIAMGGKYDGIGVEDTHKIADWAVSFGEQITGEKASEKDKQTINEFSDFIAQQASQSPANVRFTDKGTLFTLDGKDYLYDAETQSVTSKQGVTEPEKQNAVNVAQEMMANYNKAIKEGDFTGLFGENVRPYNQQQNEAQQNSTVSQPQETLETQAAEIVTPTDQNQGEIPQIAQEAPEGESAEIAQEPANVEAAEVAPTAEELDVRRAEIAPILQKTTQDVTVLSNEIAKIEQSFDPLADNADEIIADLEIKNERLAQLEAQVQELTTEDANIANLRQTIKTESEVLTEKTAAIQEKLAQNEVEMADLGKKSAEAIKNKDYAAARAIGEQIKSLKTEKEILGQEIEALQPKEIAKEKLPLEKPVAEKQVSSKMEQTETPIAETPKAEKKVVEKEGNEIEFGKLYNDNEKVLTKESREKSKNHNNNLQKQFENELKDGDTIISASGEELYYKDGVVLWKKDGTKYGMVDVPTMAILNGNGNAKIIHTPKSKGEITPTPETKAEKEVETPVAPAAPKEEGNKPEKGKTQEEVAKEETAKKLKPLPIRPKKETLISPPKKVNSGKELAEMLGNNEQAQETGKAWDKVAETWAKKTGKTVTDWWNRIESIQVGGEKSGARGSVEIENGKFKVFLASDRDVSTPMHELAHIFQTDLSASEKKSVVDWYNEKNGTNHSVSDWGFAETDTSRKISEYFAEGFIEWLKEGGKTTDKAMRSVFSKFKEWLKGVINSVFDAKVELNDDVRKIYEEIFTEKEKVEIAKRQKAVKVNEESIDPVELTWNYFARGGKANRKEIMGRLKKRFKDGIPKDVLDAIEPFVEDNAPVFDKLGEQLHSNLTDNNPEIYIDESEFVDAADAIFEEIGKGFSKVVTAKIKEYAATKNQSQDEEAINAQAEDAIEQAKINRPSEAERLRMKYENEIDLNIMESSGLFQANSSEMQEMVDWAVDGLIDSGINRQSTEEQIEGAKEALMEAMQDSGFEAAEMQQIVDRAIYKVTAPLDAETALSEHADKIEEKRNEIIEKERQSLPQDTIDTLREEVKKIAETITDSTTQEEIAQMQAETKNMLISKGMSQKDAQDLVNEFIRERSFGTKFRDNYAPQMSQELRDAVMKQTYFYRVVSNSTAIQKAEAKINEWYEKAIENVAQKWHDNGQKPDATNQDFIADTYEELMDLVNNALFNEKITADYYVKVAAAMYAIKLADTLVGNLTAKAKTRVLDKTVILVNNLAELGTIFGRTINMYGVMANVSGGVLQAIFKKEMSNIIANMSFSQKVNKDAIEAVLDGVAGMVQGIKDGTNKGLIQSLVDAMEGNKSVEKLLEKIVENATNEQDIIDILNKIDDLEIQKEALKKEIRDKLVLEAKIREKNKEIAQLRAALAAKKPATGTTNKNTQKQKTAAKTKYDSLIDEVVSFGQNLFSNSLYQTIEGFQSTMFATYKPEVITKVNDIMKNITDFVYLGNENVSAERLYKMVQTAAKKEFAQKYLEKANIQPDVPLNTGQNLTKAQESANKAAIAKNKEKQNQKQLHQDILDAINNDKFKASIEAYIQENQANDIRAQMRKRVTGIVNDTNATAAEKKVELRKALVQMVGEAATSTNEATKGIKDFMRAYFDVTGKDVTAFEAEFDKMWAEQVKKKQLDLIKKRLETSAEKDAKLTDKVIKDLIKHFETNKEFGHKFSEDLAKNIRITEKNWTGETAKRFRDTYHIPISTAHNQKKIADMIKYIDTLPNGTDAKEAAMNVVMNEYLNIVGVSNLDRWVALVDVMFHVNNLLNLPTIWQNIRDSLYQVAHDIMLPVANFFGEVITAMVDKENFRTALNKAQRANRLNSKVVFKTLFSQSTKRLAQNQFSLQEARAVGEYASFMDYFAKSFTELPSELKNFKFNSVLDFIQYGIPAALMFAYDEARLGVVTAGSMSGPDLALGNALQMGRMANILSRKGIDSKEAMELADISTAGDRVLDYGGKMQKISDILTSEREKGYFANQEAILKVWNDAIASGKTEEQTHNAIKQAVADGTITSDYKREWRRKMELFAEYIEQEYAAWIIADTYRRNATYKTDPTGLLGMAYRGVTSTAIRSSRQNEMEAREAYNRDKSASNLAKQKGWQLAKLAFERILGGEYLRTKINLANKYLLNSFIGNLLTHIKNYTKYMDTDAAMKLAVNKKGDLVPNSLWYIDDLAHKGFLKEVENKLQADIDKINEAATEKKEAVTIKENAQIEKIDNTISDKEKALKERKAAIDKVSDKKQESIDKKIDKRKEVIDTFTKKIQGINDLFAEKEQKILDSISAAIAKIESKILDIEIKAVDKVSAKNAKIETKITQYVRKREQLYAQSLLIDRKIESETSDFESMLLELNEQEKAISEKLGNDEKVIFSDFVNKKRQELADLYGKKVSELNKKKAIKSAQIAEAITLFEFQLENYKNIYESSIDYIQRDVQRFVETAENNIKKVAASEDSKIQENSGKRDEAVQKVKDTQKQRVAALDHELNVAINVEKEKYNRQKAYLDGVFAKEKAQLESEKSVIARKAEADRGNIDNLAAAKAKPLTTEKGKIANKIASYDANYRIGYADEKARQVRIGVTTALLLASYLFSNGDDDDEEKPMIEVVGDITAADGGTKASNQNTKEANSKKKLIIRAFGQQLSFNFMDKANVMDLLAWGEVFDHLARKKRGVVSDKSIVDVAARPMLTFIQQIFAFRDASTLDFTNPFKEPSENILKAGSNLSPVKMPAQFKQIVSDFIYNGQQYDLPDNETYFKQYLRLLGIHPEFLSNEDAKYAVRYSMINGQPIRQYTGDNSNEINRLIATGIWGKETSTSFNDFTIKPDKANVLFKEMEFLSWLHDRGLTSAINITNPDDIAPKVADGILLGTNPMPVDEFQENVLKPTAIQASDKLRKMYKSEKFNGKTEKQIILSVKNLKSGEEAAKDYLESNKTDLAALNIGLKYITKDLWESTKKEVLMKYLKEKKPNYKRPGESYTTYKNRVKLK